MIMKLSLVCCTIILLLLLSDITDARSRKRCRKCRQKDGKRDETMHRRKHARKHMLQTTLAENITTATSSVSQDLSDFIDEDWLAYLESQYRPSAPSTAQPPEKEINEYTEALVDILLNLDEGNSLLHRVNATKRKGVHISTQKTTGKFGFHSPRKSVFGKVVHVSDGAHLGTHFGCTGDIDNKKDIPRPGAPWIALIARGSCTFFTKIKLAEEYNASAVVVYDADKSESVEVMSTRGTEIPSLMIKAEHGKSVSRLIDRGQPMYMNITVGEIRTKPSDNGENTEGAGNSDRSPRTNILLLLLCLAMLTDWQ